MAKNADIELAQLKYALQYLAELWESSPLSGEDAETSRRHAQILRALIHLHVRFLGPEASENQIKAAVQRARQVGRRPEARATQEEIAQMRRALREAELADLFAAIEDYLREQMQDPRTDPPEEE